MSYNVIHETMEDLVGQIEYFLEKSENQELYGHFTEYHQPSFTDCVQPPRVYKYVKIISVVFKPQKDITAYELAVILGILEGYKKRSIFNRGRV